MQITNEELFGGIVAVEKHLQNVEDLLHSTIELQQQMGKYLAVKLPGTPEERQIFQSHHMRGESTLDQLQAATRTWREQFDAFVKRVTER